MKNIKEEAKQLLDKLPDEASWDDVMYEIYVKKKMSEGLEAADEGKVMDHDEIRKQYKDKWK